MLRTMVEVIAVCTMLSRSSLPIRLVYARAVDQPNAPTCQGGLPASCDLVKLKEHFGQFGEIQDAVVQPSDENNAVHCFPNVSLQVMMDAETQRPGHADCPSKSGIVSSTTASLHVVASLMFYYSYPKT